MISLLFPLQLFNVVLPFCFFYFSRIINLNAYKNNNNLKNAGTEIDFVSLFFSDLFRWQNNKQTTN